MNIAAALKATGAILAFFAVLAIMILLLKYFAIWMLIAIGVALGAIVLVTAWQDLYKAFGG